MKRLTERNFNFTTDFVKRNIDAWSISQCLEKLQKYEDAEEQKMLFKFPCKVGDTVYVIFSKNGIPRYEECEVEQIIIHAGIIEMNVLIKMEHIRSRLDIRMFGKTIFHTREEVWQKIKEM